MSAQAIADRIIRGADAIPGTGTLWRHGRINAARAVCLPAPHLLHRGAVGANSIELEWRDRASFESYFQIGRRPLDASAWTYATAPTNTQSYADTGVSPGQGYAYRCAPATASPAPTSALKKGPPTPKTPPGGETP